MDVGASLHSVQHFAGVVCPSGFNLQMNFSAAAGGNCDDVEYCLRRIFGDGYVGIAGIP